MLERAVQKGRGGCLFPFLELSEEQTRENSSFNPHLPLSDLYQHAASPLSSPSPKAPENGQQQKAF